MSSEMTTRASCGHILTKVVHKGILYGWYCLVCDAEYLPKGYKGEHQMTLEED